MPEPYIIKSTIRYNRAFHDRFSELVDRVPFDGRPRQEREYRLQLRRFLMHLEHCANYDRGASRNGWTPISYSLGVRELPLIFGQNRYMATKGIRWLTRDRANAIVEVRLGSFLSGRSHEYRIVPAIRRSLYEGIRNLDEAGSFEQFKDSQRLYDIARPIEDQRPITWDRVIRKALERGVTTPSHDFSALRKSRDARRRYVAAYERLQPHVLNLDALLRCLYIIQHSEPTDVGIREDRRIHHYNQVARAVETILARGIALADGSDHRLIAYRPAYSVAAIGGRGFEIGGGFQTLPGWVKSVASEADNYDVRNSQMEILRVLLRRYRIPCEFLDQYPTMTHVQRALAIDRNHAKSLFYGLLFNGGRRVGWAHNATYYSLAGGIMGESGARQVIANWNSLTDSLSLAIREFIERRWSEAHYAKCYSWGSPTLIRFHADSKTFKARKRLLAHVIQGAESDYILRLLESEDNRISALEHDGCMGVIQTEPGGTLYLEQKSSAMSRHQLQAELMNDDYWRLSRKGATRDD